MLEGEIHQMALEMKHACQHCQCTLPQDTDMAVICSYECTFCMTCATDVFSSRCPNCGGELVRRPKRDAQMAHSSARETAHT